MTHNMEVQDTQVVIKVEAEGLCREDIYVELVGHDKLVVSTKTASRRSPVGSPDHESSTDCDPSVSEKKKEPVSRTPLGNPVVLPANLDLDSIVSTLKDGVLTIEIKKKPDDFDEAVSTVRSITKEDLLKFRQLARLEESLSRKRKRVEKLRTTMQAERQSVREAELRVVKAKVQNRNQKENERRIVDISE
mmetsp:Transcript_14746/g.35032  ORF Transcript_14746/g.35032 Transcript_14746/m.35032 type:complete len:191 (+) Transcript_14746:99-671(+)